MLPTQEPKYDVDARSGRIFNRTTGENIPENEPVMILRAKDKNAAMAIAYYKKLCSNKNHAKIIKGRLHDFVEFSHNYPEKMKEPD